MPVYLHSTFKTTTYCRNKSDKPTKQKSKILPKKQLKLFKDTHKTPSIGAALKIRCVLTD